MKYIDDTDLASVIQERFLDESTANIAGNDAILLDLEQKAIDYVISYITGRFNTTLIFYGEAPLRNGVLKQIMAQIVVYRAVRRNAARKVPEDLIELYKDATKSLERIQSGAMALPGLPLITASDGTTSSLQYGNSTNRDFFI